MNIRKIFDRIFSKKNENNNKKYEVVYWTPYNINRWIILLLYLIVNSTTTYMYLGWARGLQDMLYRSGAYIWDCPLEIKVEEDYLPRCNTQQRKVANLFSVTISSGFVSAIIAGMCLDFFGPKITAILGIFIDLCGWIMLAESHKFFIAYIPAMSFIGMGCNFVGMSIIIVSRLFPEKKRTITAVVASTASFSMSICVTCNLIWQKNTHLFTFRKIIWIYIAIECTIALPIILFFLPWKVFSPPEKKIHVCMKHNESLSNNTIDFCVMGNTETFVKMSSLQNQKNENIQYTDNHNNHTNFVEMSIGSVDAAVGCPCNENIVNEKINNISTINNTISVDESQTLSQNISNNINININNNDNKHCCLDSISPCSFAYNEQQNKSCAIILTYNSDQSNSTSAENNNNNNAYKTTCVLYNNNNVSLPNVDIKNNFISKEVCLLSHDIYKNNVITSNKQDTVTTTNIEENFTPKCSNDYCHSMSFEKKTNTLNYNNCCEYNTATLDTSTSLPVINDINLYTSGTTINEKNKGNNIYRWIKNNNFMKKNINNGCIKEEGEKKLCYKNSHNRMEKNSIGDKIKKNILDPVFISSLKESIYILSIFNFSVTLLRNNFLYKTSYNQLGKEVYETIGYVFPFMFISTWICGILSQRLGPIFGFWVTAITGLSTYIFAIIPLQSVKWLSLFFFWIHMSFMQTSLYIFLLEIFALIHFGKLSGIAYLIGGLASLVGIPMFDAAVLHFKRFLEMDLVILGLCVANVCSVAYINYAYLKMKNKQSK